MDKSIDTYFLTIVSSIKRIIEEKGYIIHDQLTRYHLPSYNCTITTDVFTAYIFYQESDARFFVRIRAHHDRNRSKYNYHSDVSPFRSDIDEFEMMLYELESILPENKKVIKMETSIYTIETISTISTICIICLVLLYYWYR